MRTLDLDQFWPTLTAQPSGQDSGDRLAVSTAVAGGDRSRELGSSLGLSDRLEFLSVAPDPSLASRLLAARPASSPLSGLASKLRHHAARFYRFTRGFDPHAAVWLSFGFVSGMAAWHAVGFWGFVSATVLQESGRTSPLVAQSEPLKPRAHFKSIITTGSITPSEAATFSPQLAACVALTNDSTGATISLPCRAGQQPLRDAGRRKRADRMPDAEARLQNAGSWATDIQAAAPPARVEDATGTLSEADFDLSLATSKADAERSAQSGLD